MTQKKIIHQITLLGGQILPVYWGVLEKTPNVVHILYTKESRNSVTAITNQFKNIKFESYQIDPYDYTGIKDLAEQIVFKNIDDQFQLNLTSGTKVMALACQTVFNSLDREFEVFYIDQKHRLFEINTESYKPLMGTISTKTLFSLSGHVGITSHKISDYSKDEIDLSYQILLLTSNNSGLNKLFQNIRKTYKDVGILETLNYKQNNQSVSLKNGELNISLQGHTIHSKSPKASRIVFDGLWWEILIADVTKSWGETKEQLMEVLIPTKRDQKKTKNEIDILLSTGRNFIFIECKAGNVTQGDINKIRTIKRMYGGVSSKSILICRYIPKPELLEKCSDLGIEIFSYQSNYKKNKQGQFISLNSLKDINKKLDLLAKRLEV